MASGKIAFLMLLAAIPFSSQNPLDLDALSINHHSSPTPPLWPSKTSIQYTSELTFTSSSKTTAHTTPPTTSTPFIPIATEISKSGRVIYVKTGIQGCNFEGTANTYLQSRILYPGSPSTDVLACQGSCRFTTACEAYSFNTVTSNCTFYNGDSVGEVVEDVGGGTFFSNKYPADGSDFCYDDQVPVVGSTWLYPYPQRMARATVFGRN